MKRLLFILGLCTLIGISSVRADTLVYDGRISVIGEDYIVLEVGERMMTLELARYSYQHGFKTEFYTEFGYQTNFEALYGTGFVDRARVHVDDDVVTRLDVIRLQPE